MELKDVILSTLAEMEENNNAVEGSQKENQVASSQKSHKVDIQEEKKIEENFVQKIFEESETIQDDEILYLTSIRERLLVLFEGFQAPNNTNIEAKIDMTLNFLEYVLATLDNRIEKIQREGKK